MQSLSLPGYICTVFLVDKVSLRVLQLTGFFATAIVFVFLAGLSPQLEKVLKVNAQFSNILYVSKCMLCEHLCLAVMIFPLESLS